MTTTAPITIAPSAVKSTLARLLSTESIAVVHDPKISTAFFDLKARSLHLPVWKDVTNALYDMLVGHEVAHALWTGADDWRTGIETVQSRTGVSRETAAGTLNVVEDARIERMIKDKFPGLRRDFHSGYGTLHARGFFGDLSRIPTLGFADRVNLHFKIGLHLGTAVPFSAAEAPIVAAVEAATTWSNVVDAAVALITHAQTTKQQQAQSRSEDGDEAAQGSDTGDDAGTESEGGEDGTESEDGTAGGQDTRSLSPGTEDGDGDGDESGNDGEAAQGVVTQHTWGSDPGAPVTDSALERAIREQLVDSTNSDSAPVYTAVVPEGGLQCPAWRVVDYPAVMERFDKLESDIRAENAANTNTGWNATNNANLLNALREPVRSRFHTEATNSMFTAFDRRKAADVFRRSRVSNSGALDPLRMNQFRWNEDIFRKNTRLAEGKNHGIVIALDWSGSMGGIMRETIGQLFIITDFCRRAGIPFEVYSFSDVEWTHGGDDMSSNRYAEVGNPDLRAVASTLTLANWLSSRMTKPQYERMKSALAAFRLWNYCNHAHNLSLGSTPTTAATFALAPIVEQFVKRNRVQIPHVLFLTDGEPSDTIEFVEKARANSGYFSAGRRASVVMRDATTGVAYSLMPGHRDEHRAQDAAYNTCPDASYLDMPSSNWGCDSRLGWIARDMIRRRTGAAIHWIGLSTNAKRSTMPSFVEADGSAYSRDGYARGRAAGWDSAVVARASDFCVLTNNSEIETRVEEGRAQRFDRLLSDGLKTAKRTASGGFSASAVKSLAGAMSVRNSAKSVATIIGEVVAV